MNSYNKMPTRTRKNCQQCGEVFRGFEDEGICLRCKSYQEHPEEAPGVLEVDRPGTGTEGQVHLDRQNANALAGGDHNGPPEGRLRVNPDHSPGGRPHVPADGESPCWTFT